MYPFGLKAGHICKAAAGDLRTSSLANGKDPKEVRDCTRESVEKAIESLRRTRRKPLEPTLKRKRRTGECHLRSVKRTTRHPRKLGGIISSNGNSREVVLSRYYGVFFFQT